MDWWTWQLLKAKEINCIRYKSIDTHVLLPLVPLRFPFVVLTCPCRELVPYHVMLTS